MHEVNGWVYHHRQYSKVYFFSSFSTEMYVSLIHQTIKMLLKNNNVCTMEYFDLFFDNKKEQKKTNMQWGVWLTMFNWIQ